MKNTLSKSQRLIFETVEILGLNKERLAQQLKLTTEVFEKKLKRLDGEAFTVNEVNYLDYEFAETAKDLERVSKQLEIWWPNIADENVKRKPFNDREKILNDSGDSIYFHNVSNDHTGILEAKIYMEKKEMLESKHFAHVRKMIGQLNLKTI